MEKDIFERYASNFYKIMAENFGDEMFVTDGEGVVLFVNPAAVDVIGKPVYDIIGKNVTELVRDGFFKPSVTAEVLRQKKTVNMLQTVKDGKTVLATGVPIFDNDHNKIRMVISTTKDFEALQKLIETINDQQEVIESLRKITFDTAEFITAKEDSDIKKMILKIAPLDVTVLIQGETGVGKEAAVRAIHMLGHGKEKPLVKINCGIIPESLIESELFGYEQGAFTGAEKGGKKGKVEMAEGGTLFLDEIGEMPLSLQVKLLDFLQDNTFTRVGGTKKQKVHTRVIAATNRDLSKMCSEDKFRKDLFFRLNVFPFIISPLRDRKDDIAVLARYFLSNCNSKYKGEKTLSEEAMMFLNEYWWPGNVRELMNAIERAYIISESDRISSRDFNFLEGETSTPVVFGGIMKDGIYPGLKEAKREVEQLLVGKAYKEYQSTYKVAEALGVDQSTVSKIMKRIRGEANKGRSE
jgi:PAS domain S-box-containing protein